MCDIETIIRQVGGSMAMAGMPLTEQDRERIRMAAEQDELTETEVASLIAKHSKKER